MNSIIPNLGQFRLNPLDQAQIESSRSQISFNVDVEHDRMTHRILVGLMDEKTSTGVAVAIYPATGEVCDLSNGGGVIGYLSNAPIVAHQSIPVEVLIYKFGQNCVCCIRVNGETFLYPAFMLADATSLTAIVGNETDHPEIDDHTMGWDGALLSVSDIAQAVAA